MSAELPQTPLPPQGPPANSPADRLMKYFEQLGERHALIALVMELAARDRAAYGSVLGSAVALRLFLFSVPTTTVFTAMVGIFRLRSLLEEHLEEAASVGTVAKAVGEAHGAQAVWLLLSGVLVALWAGRALTRVLHSSAQLAWQITDAPKLKLVTTAAATGVVASLTVTASILRALRHGSGPTVYLATWLLIAAVAGYAFFLLTITLPRAVSDPGALLPGSIAFAAGFTALQAVMHVYVNSRVSRTSDTLGALAGTIAVLGFLFAIGRLITLCTALNAVIHERYGSISDVIFALPVIRLLPRRYPSVAKYFSLERDAPVLEHDGADDSP